MPKGVTKAEADQKVASVTEAIGKIVGDVQVEERGRKSREAAEDRKTRPRVTAPKGASSKAVEKPKENDQ